MTGGVASEVNLSNSCPYHLFLTIVLLGPKRGGLIFLEGQT